MELRLDYIIVLLMLLVYWWLVVVVGGVVNDGGEVGRLIVSLPMDVNSCMSLRFHAPAYYSSPSYRLL